MPEVSCKVCNKEFYVKPSHQKRGWGKCCSRKCRDQLARKGKLFNCSICNKETYYSPFRLLHSKSRNYFCGKPSQTTWRNSLYIGESHKNWKDGTKSYREILKRNSINPECFLCKAKNPLLLAVHHKDHNRHNNDISNLLWLCHNCHYLAHHDSEFSLKIAKGTNQKEI